jgi:hypothetical protein
MLRNRSDAQRNCRRTWVIRRYHYRAYRKAAELKEEIEIKHVLPAKKDVTAIKKAFKELETTKLTQYLII